MGKRFGRLVALVAAPLALASCGGDDGDGSAELVNPDRPARISALALDPRSGDLLLSTNRGLFRIAGGEAERIAATVRTRDGSSPIGTFLTFTRGGGELLGSGHPDSRGRLANFVGLIRSTDGGRSWRSVSRYGFSDLHVLHAYGERIFALDQLLPAVVVSDDGGRSWSERFVPQGFVFDFAVNPDDPEQMVLSYEDRMMSSIDGGRSWDPLGEADRARLAWAAADALYRADRDGRVFSSGDGGESWNLVGLLDGEPWRLEALDAEHLLAALSDATIMESSDGGASWEQRFAP